VSFDSLLSPDNDPHTPFGAPHCIICHPLLCPATPLGTICPHLVQAADWNLQCI
jgi:hypothetical protein